MKYKTYNYSTLVKKDFSIWANESVLNKDVIRQDFLRFEKKSLVEMRMAISFKEELNGLKLSANAYLGGPGGRLQMLFAYNNETMQSYYLP